MIKMFIMFGSLCFSAYMLPKTLDKLGGSGLGSMLQPGGGIGPDAQRLLGEGGLDSLLGAEKASTNGGGGPVIITPNGEMSDEAYQRLVRQAQRQAPIKVVKGVQVEKGKAAGETDIGAVASEDSADAVARMLELLEEQKKGG